MGGCIIISGAVALLNSQTNQSIKLSNFLFSFSLFVFISLIIIIIIIGAVF